MKKFIQIIVFTFVFVFGISSVAICDMAELIDNVTIEKIVSMEVRPLYILTDQAFAGLRDEGVPEPILVNPGLLALKDQSYDGREVFVSALEQVLGADALKQVIGKYELRILFLRHAKQRPSARTTHYLDVIADIVNKNERDLKLTDCTFEFYIRDEEAVGELIRIGADTFYKTKDIYLESNPESDPGKIMRVKFSVEMGSDQSLVFDTLAYIVNFVGKPSKDDYLFISGRFNLGMKSEKGWTYGEAVKVEWMFCPTIQDTLPLSECFRE
jgi:hypothetical protein